MPKRLPSDLRERVVAALSQHPEGLALAHLEKRLKDVASRRSLQRKLDQWVRRGAIRADGIRRGRRYSSTASPDSAVITPEDRHVDDVVGSARSRHRRANFDSRPGDTSLRSSSTHRSTTGWLSTRISRTLRAQRNDVFARHIEKPSASTRPNARWATASGHVRTGRTQPALNRPVLVVEPP